MTPDERPDPRAQIAAARSRVADMKADVALKTARLEAGPKGDTIGGLVELNRLVLLNLMIQQQETSILNLELGMLARRMESLGAIVDTMARLSLARDGG